MDATAYTTVLYTVVFFTTSLYTYHCILHHLSMHYQCRRPLDCVYSRRLKYCRWPTFHCFKIGLLMTYYCLFCCRLEAYLTPSATSLPSSSDCVADLQSSWCLGLPLHSMKGPQTKVSLGSMFTLANSDYGGYLLMLCMHSSTHVLTLVSAKTWFSSDSFD